MRVGVLVTGVAIRVGCGFGSLTKFAAISFIAQSAETPVSGGLAPRALSREQLLFAELFAPYAIEKKVTCNLVGSAAVSAELMPLLHGYGVA